MAVASLAGNTFYERIVLFVTDRERRQARRLSFLRSSGGAVPTCVVRLIISAKISESSPDAPSPLRPHLRAAPNESSRPRVTLRVFYSGTTHPYLERPPPNYTFKRSCTGAQVYAAADAYPRRHLRHHAGAVSSHPCTTPVPPMVPPAPCQLATHICILLHARCTSTCTSEQATCYPWQVRRWTLPIFIWQVRRWTLPAAHRRARAAAHLRAA